MNTMNDIIFKKVVNMENAQEIIKELNKFLKGINMGSDTFKQYEEKAQAPELKQELNKIISIFKSHEEKTVAAIQKLGGEAKDSLGITGELASMFEKIKDIFVDTDKEVLEHAIKAVIMGKDKGTTVLQTCKDLNADQFIIDRLTEILNDYETTSDALNKLSNKM